MASPSEMSSGSRSTSSLMPGRIVIACDATRSHSTKEFKDIIANIQARNGMIQEVDTITVLGVLDKVLHPMGFQMQISPNSFIGTRVRAIKEAVSKMVDEYVCMLHHSTEECAGKGVIIEVKIVVGAPLKNVVVQEAVTSNATWVVLDRYLRKELRFYIKHLPCKMALVLDNFSLEVSRSHFSDKATPSIEQKVVYTQAKLVPLLPADHSLISPSVRSVHSQESSDTENGRITPFIKLKSMVHRLFLPDVSNTNPQLEKSGSQTNMKDICCTSPPVERKQNVLDSSSSSRVMGMQSALTYPNVPVDWIISEMKSSWDSSESSQSTYSDKGTQIAQLSYHYLPTEDKIAQVENNLDGSCAIVQNQSSLKMDSGIPRDSRGMKIGTDRMQCCYSEVQAATNNFSSDNLLGEGGYGAVYKGQLQGGRLIIVKVRKEANAHTISDFHTEVDLLGMAYHKNIVMLLGYCLNENILIYEYVCNKTLEWHLFDNTEHVLEWHRRYAIAIGIAKGLRFLHEECRGSPIIHGDIRPNNIFLTHEFVPLLGDCGLAKWKTNKLDEHLKVLEALEYLSPECVESGNCSTKTDVFSFGILLIQLISGRKAVDPTTDDHHKSLRQWAMPLIQTLELDVLVDHRLGDSYSTYELYQMARLAYSCVQSKPSMRPSIGEVLHLLLKGESDHLSHLTEQSKICFSIVPE